MSTTIKAITGPILDDNIAEGIAIFLAHGTAFRCDCQDFVRSFGVIDLEPEEMTVSTSETHAGIARHLVYIDNGKKIINSVDDMRAQVYATLDALAKRGAKTVAMNGIRIIDYKENGIRSEAYQRRFVEDYLAEHPNVFKSVSLVDLRGGFRPELACVYSGTKKTDSLPDDCDGLDGNDWAGFLKMHPEFADRCAWEKLDEDDWIELLSEQPQFIGKYPWYKLIDAHPGTSISQCCRLLALNSSFATSIPWDKLDGWVLSSIFRKFPQYASKHLLDKLDGCPWAQLLMEQPQFADQCPWDKLAGMSEWYWAQLLGKQPQFADKCPWNRLDKKDMASYLKACCSPADLKQFAKRLNS